MFEKTLPLLSVTLIFASPLIFKYTFLRRKVVLVSVLSTSGTVGPLFSPQPNKKEERNRQTVVKIHYYRFHSKPM